MKPIINSILLSLIVINAFSQTDSTTYWKKGGMVTINFSQIELTNWAAGGENSISGNGLLSVFANFAKDNSAWDNTLDLGYGMVKQGSKNLIKSDDKIEINSKYGYKASKRWFYSALINFKSQFSEGFNYPNDSVVISNFFAPAYLIYSVGMDFKPNAKFTCYLSPVTGRTTFVYDQRLADAGAFGVDPAEYDITGLIKTKDGKNARYEFGGLIKVMYRNEIFKNISLQSKIDFFSSYLKNPQNIDINWENLINFKVNGAISANIFLHLIYDDDTQFDTNGDGIMDGPQIQFKEVFGIGFSYKF